MRSCTLTLALVSLIPVGLAHSAEVDSKPVESKPMQVGGFAVGEILERLGAKMESGISSEQLTGYSHHFDRVDLDRDGRHSKEEFIDKGS